MGHQLFYFHSILANFYYISDRIHCKYEFVAAFQYRGPLYCILYAEKETDGVFFDIYRYGMCKAYVGTICFCLFQ